MMRKDGRMNRINRVNRIKIGISILLAAVSVVLSVAARQAPGFAQWYGTHLYPVWVGSMGRVMGFFPFSVSEMLLYLLAACFLIGFVRKVSRRLAGLVYKPSSSRSRPFSINKRRAVWNMILLAAVLCFLYVVNCGINYHKDSFSEISGISVEEYTAEELKEVCEWLTDRVAAYSGKVKRGTEGEMLLDIPLESHAVEAMEELGEEYSELAGYYPNPKELVNSWILSVQSLSGVYSPFTIEANYNGDMPDYYIPFTACHELSHLRGFMQEQEANFISFLACTGSEEAAFAYSGSLSGWVQCMNVLYRADYDAWEEVRERLPEEVEADLKVNREFWAKYDGRIAEVSNHINDTYLKANGQKDGVESYNRMVDLIVSYYKMR